MDFVNLYLTAPRWCAFVFTGLLYIFERKITKSTMESRASWCSIPGSPSGHSVELLILGFLLWMATFSFEGIGYRPIFTASPGSTKLYHPYTDASAHHMTFPTLWWVFWSPFHGDIMGWYRSQSYSLLFDGYRVLPAPKVLGSQFRPC